jgi:hypothetical protein
MQRNVKYFRGQLKWIHGKGPKFLCEKDRHEIFNVAYVIHQKSNFSVFSSPETASELSKAVQDNSPPPIMLQPWMRKEVLTKFGRTTANKWQPQSNELNPFRDYSREDIDPLPIKKRIRYWKLARGDRVT